MRRLLGIFALSLFLAPLYAEAAPKKDDKKEDEDEEDDTDSKPLPTAKDFEEDEEDEPGPKRLEEGDKDEPEKEPDDIDFNDDDEDDEIEFRDDDIQEDVKPRQPGEDTAQLYRDAQKKNSEMTPDEELLAWERYLAKYPKSIFRERIEERQEELSSTLFGERVPGSDRGARAEDAAKRELNFAIPAHYPAIDTRSRLSGGVQVGIPNWASGWLDFEWAFFRELSVHGRFEREYTNTTISAGAKYALIKSSRTGTVLTGGLDLRVYAAPAFVGLRPSVGFGQRINVMDGLDLQAQIAVDPEFRDPLGIRYFAGFGGELRPNKTVAVFAETTFNYKYLGSEEFTGPFRFDVITFGLKFNVAKAKNADGDSEVDVGIGANIPYSTNYWGFYRGAVDVNGNWNL